MKKKIGFTLLLLVVAVGAAWWFTRPAPIEMSSTTSYLLDWPERVIVETGMGTVTGLSNGQSLVFLGLPYAQPPTATNRFEPPQTVDPWSGVLDATEFPDICVQDKPRERIGDTHRSQITEDCLYLNIFTPATDGEPRPVLFWIHGGSFTSGSANNYDGSILAEQGDVVVVAINYRLGMLGFLDLSGFGEAYAGSAANGIRDQIAALRWVRDNIGAFGGDKDNVTIFGESAGGQSVMAIMSAPSADGLYHKAIEHSGAEVNTHAVDARTALAEKLEVSEDALLATLQTLPAEELVTMQSTIRWGGGGRIDGTVITRGAKDAIIERGLDGVPLIAGSNLDEGTLFSFLVPSPFYGFVGEAVAENILEGVSGKDYVEGLKVAYPDDDSTERFERIWKDLLVRGGANAAARASAAGPGGWLYRFDLPVQRVPGFGATHAAEIAFTFNLFARQLAETAYLYDPQDAVVQELAQIWSRTIIQFAKTGNPNGAGLPQWPRYTAETREALILDGNLRVMHNIHAADRERWGDTEVFSSQYQSSRKTLSQPVSAD